MKPSVGRIVHYVSYGTPPGPDGSQAYTSQCRAAVVTEVGEVFVPEGESYTPPGTPVSLAVLNPEGMFFNRGVMQDELPPLAKIVAGERSEHRGGTWHWPERVES